MKASDLDDRDVVNAVRRIQLRDGFGWAFTGQVADEFPSAPFKVVAAKLAKLKRRGLLAGCACGCRGDWEPTPAGLALIEGPASEPEEDARG